MLTTLPTLTVSAMYLLWNACRRYRLEHDQLALPLRSNAPDGEAADNPIEHRLTYHTCLMKRRPR